MGLEFRSMSELKEDSVIRDPSLVVDTTNPHTILHLQGVDHVTVISSGTAVTLESKFVLQMKIDEVARELREIKLGLEELKKELSKMDFSNPFQ